jgi:hypothetical protein
MPGGRVEAWYIYHVKNCVHTRPPKPKFVIIAFVTPQPMGFLINSHIADFILQSPDLNACQAAIDAHDHSCLNHNSYVDCKEIFPFKNSELNDKLSPVSDWAREQIVRAVYKCPVLERRYKKLILANEKAIVEQIEAENDTDE